MNIGQAAQHVGISVKMIRYYEQIGLFQITQRSAAGYRIYAERDLKQLHFIRHARDLGFSSAQMKDLISLWHQPNRHSAEVKTLAQAHIAQLKQKIDMLQTMVSDLERVTECCAGDEGADCSILRYIENAE